jgi:ActR/RegA family two-component response regulator
LAETILIVDDEDSVRQTFQEWLEEANFGCQVLAARDAAEALTLANEQRIDLAILDWHLGAGSHGLQLLEDLYLFHPDLVAILVTGFAHQATPLDALRMGVRDYLDKTTDLTRERFLAAVHRQLERIRPVKRERQVQQTLLEFRSEVERLLPIVSAAAALHEPGPGPEAVAGLFDFLMPATQARAGLLLARAYDPQREPAESCRWYDHTGRLLDLPAIPFAQTLAAAVVGMQSACALSELPREAAELGIVLNPVEQQHQFVLAAPITVTPNLIVVVELFDKLPQGSPAPQPFDEADRRLADAAARFAAHLVRQALAERQTQTLLLEALAAASRTAEQLRTEPGPSRTDQDRLEPRDRILRRLQAAQFHLQTPRETLRLAELIGDLSSRHGSSAVEFAIVLLEGLRRLLAQEPP